MDFAYILHLCAEKETGVNRNVFQKKFECKIVHRMPAFINKSCISGANYKIVLCYKYDKYAVILFQLYNSVSN